MVFPRRAECRDDGFSLAKRDQDNIRNLAELQATAAIGEIVLSLHAAGQAVDVPALLAHMQAELSPLNYALASHAA
jgi:hypothetical protein